MSDLIGGALLVVAAGGFLLRVALGAPEARRWRCLCGGTRSVLMAVGLGCLLRGLTLMRHQGEIDPGGSVTVALIALYSVAMAVHEFKNGRLEFPSWNGMDRRDQRSPFDVRRI